MLCPSHLHWSRQVNPNQATFLLINGNIFFFVQTPISVARNLPTMNFTARFAKTKPLQLKKNKALSTTVSIDFLLKFYQMRAITGFVRKTVKHPPQKSKLTLIEKQVKLLSGMTAKQLKSQSTKSWEFTIQK